MRMIYLDNNATTAMDADVLSAMLPYFMEEYGNASSVLNVYGRHAEEAVNEAIDVLKDIFHASSRRDFIFTSGATEANNLAISGIVQSYQKMRPHIITSGIEHQSVLQVCRFWEMQGVQCTYLEVDSSGIIDLQQLREEIRDNTVLISVMAANNEIGTIQPIGEIGELAHSNHILFHTDATQYMYYKIINLQEMPMDMLSFSAHKIHGPKGVGVLYANGRARRRLRPILFGGNQQWGIRSGTLNVPGIVGISKAIEILSKSQCKDSMRIKKLRDELYELLCKNHSVYVNGSLEQRLPNNLNVRFSDVKSFALISKLPELAVSVASACLSSTSSSSHVLKALHLAEDEIHSSVRFGLSKYTTEEEIIYVARVINQALGMLH